MQLPRNRKYMEISFHVILTVLILTAAGLVLFRLNAAKNVVLEMAGRVLAIFAPVLWALVFSVLLEDGVCFFQRKYEALLSPKRKRKVKNRKAGTSAVFGLMGLLLLAGGVWLTRKLGGTDPADLAEGIGRVLEKLGDLPVLLQVKLAEYGILQSVERPLAEGMQAAAEGLQAAAGAFLKSLPSFGGGVLDFFLGMVLAFYFLMEKESILGFLKRNSLVFLGERKTEGLKRFFGELHFVFSGYFCGQLTDAVIMGTLFSAAFTIAGLPYGILLGAVSGLSNLIPYFGALAAFVLASAAAFLTGTPEKMLTVSVMILLLQQLDSIFIVPKVLGKRVELPPVLVLLSLMVFGRLFGFWGFLLAVPLGAFCRDFLIWLYEKKRNRTNISVKSLK